MAPSNNYASLADYVVQYFIKGGALQPSSKPGFNHAMKLSYNTIDTKRISIDGPKSFTYRYKLSPDVPKYTVGLFTALMDELSTDACFRVGQPSAPGLSLQMQTELVHPIREASDSSSTSLNALDEVDIITHVTKLGRTISHTTTDFRCVKSQTLIAYSSHVKYMPTGSWLFDLVMTNKFVNDLYERFVLRHATVPLYDEKPIREVLESQLEYHNAGQRATFHMTREHTNPMGGLHGGCHAMVMELVATQYAKSQLKVNAVAAEAMQIDYLSAGKGSIEVVCETIGERTESDAPPSMHVRVLLKMGGRVCSDGKLRLVSN